MKRRLRRKAKVPMPASTGDELATVNEQLAKLEHRADRAVSEVVQQARRNHFADRWRYTLPPKEA